MGWEGEAFIGTAGSTGATRLTDSVDISLSFETEEGNTTIRGDSDVPPIDTADVTVRSWSCEIAMLNRTTDTALESMRVAAFLGTPIALRLKDYAAGKGYDGDVVLKFNHSKPLRGEQALSFTARPTRSAGRTPSLYV